MRTAPLVIAVAAVAIVPALVSLGCDKKEDQVPAPSATPVAAPPPAPPPPPPTVIPPPPAPVPPPPAPVAPPKVAVKSDAAAPIARVDSGATPPPVVGIPTVPGIPTLDPNALPAIASGIVGGIMKALPPPVAVPPPAASQ